MPALCVPKGDHAAVFTLSSPHDAHSANATARSARCARTALPATARVRTQAKLKRLIAHLAMRSAASAPLVVLDLLLVGLLSSAAACSCMVPDVSRSYNGADIVVYGRVMQQRTVGGNIAGHEYSLIRVGTVFKGCLSGVRTVLVKTPVSSATCGVGLQRGQWYLLNGHDTGDTIRDWPVYSINSCDTNWLFTSLTDEEECFLDGRFNECEGICVDGTSPASCFVDPCEVADPCPSGSASGSPNTCTANYCGGCNAEWYDNWGALQWQCHQCGE